MIVLVCSCGSTWEKRDIDAYNEGSVEHAARRHRDLWKPDGRLHRIWRVEAANEVTP